MNVELSVITVNFNTKDLTLECIKSVKKSKPSFSYEVIVVDNGSTEKLGKSPDYKLIENKDNLGFAKAVNQAIKSAKGTYMLILNSDTRVKEGSIDELYKFAKSHPDAGAVGPKLLNTDGSTQPSVYHLPTITGAIRDYWLGEKGVYEKYIPKSNGAPQVEALVMAALLITPQALKKVGVLDEKYFMYFEDLDFARRLKEVGLKVYYDPESIVEHVHGASGRFMAGEDNQWRRLIPSSKLYHGLLKHYILYLILLSAQKWQKLFRIQK